jgi:hypothetical protein
MPQWLDEAGDAVRQVIRLAKEAESPHISPRATQHARIAQKIDNAYASGNSRAEQWDARLAAWQEKMDDALTDVGDNWSELSQGHAIDDAATGVAPSMAARYGEYVQNPNMFADRGSLVANLRSIAEDGTARYPTPIQPPEEDVFNLAKGLFEDRQALRARYRQPSPVGMRVINADELIRRLR